ncbi:MAG: WhiB family transcriptional regulator, partial [Actinobacteria bacterium]|nr:WhiB family transcriptional regulator [Actinomycetota bacterium]
RECLRDAIEQREMYGIWGGTRESDRRSIIRDQRRQDRERRSDAA